MSNTKSSNHENAILGLWLNWVIAAGALVIPSLISVYSNPLFIPIVCILLSCALLIYDRASMMSRTAVCPLIVTIASRALFYSAIVMTVISIIYARGFITYFYEQDSLNTDRPFVTLLVVAPVLLFTTVWSYIRGKKYSACVRCNNMLGTTSERGFIGKMFAEESRYQRFFLLGISAALTLISWGYYTYFYINININIPDKFFFGWIPVILYLVSVFYLGARCFTLWAYYCQDGEMAPRATGTTCLRALIISGDKFFLTREEDFNETPDGHLFDTPATLTLSYHKEFPMEKAIAHFRERSMLDDDELPSDSCIFHTKPRASTTHSITSVVRPRRRLSMNPTSKVAGTTSRRWSVCSTTVSSRRSLPRRFTASTR